MVKEKPCSYSGLSVKSRYEVRIRGMLDERWSGWFDGVEVSIERSGDRLPLTILYCPAMDQARLRGMLNKLWDLNLNLVSVQQTPDQPLDEMTSEGHLKPEP